MANENEKQPTSEVIEKCTEIFQFCMVSNCESKLFFAGYMGHVNWLSVSVAHNHYSVVIYKDDIYLDRFDDEGTQKETILLLERILEDLKKISEGMYTLKHVLSFN